MPCRNRTLRMGGPVAILLLSMLLPFSVPVVAQSSDDATTSPCTGSPSADYNDQCGPSITFPAWSDLHGWDNPFLAEVIRLIDLNSDGKAELVGNGPRGLEVYSFSNHIGQWVPAFDASKPLPFPNPAAGGIRLGSIDFGQLADNLWGVIGLKSDGSGIQTWSWDPGDGSIGSGSWTLHVNGGPFASGQTAWSSSLAYWATLQFVPEPLEGAGYSIIGRSKIGMSRCSWDTGSNSWDCADAGTAFNDNMMTDSAGNLAPYFWDTVQTADIYHETAGPELFGLNNSGNLKVYSWDAGSKTFTSMTISGNAPFWSPQGQWYNVKYSSTIQAVQLLGGDNALQVIGRGQNGLEYHSINSSGCGGHTPPCWKDLTGYSSRPISDYNGFGAPQYFASMRFADLDGNGIDDLVVRDPGSSPAGKISVWMLHPSAGWYQADVATPGLIDGPLWSNHNYYETFGLGAIYGGGGPIGMVARGKYGIRTWSYHNGFRRPTSYGFGYLSPAGKNAYALANAFVGLDPNSGTTIRTQYSANVATTLSDYATCLNNSLDHPMPPTQVCALFGGGQLSNPGGVTSAQWQSMAAELLAELSDAQALTEYAADMRAFITDLFFYNEGSFDNSVTKLFPKPPGPDRDVTLSIANLLLGLARTATIVAGPEAAPANAGLLGIQTIFGAMQSMQTPESSANTRQLKMHEVQAYLTQRTSEALNRQTDVYQYVAADRSLLELYGTMLNEGFWGLTGDRLNAATSVSEYHASTWIFQTVTPLFWHIMVCIPDGGSCKNLDINHIRVGENAILIFDNGGWVAVLGDHNNDGVIPTGTTGKLFQHVFDGNAAGTCVLGGTDTNTNWTVSGGRFCNLGASIGTVLMYQAGWGVYDCTVYTESGNEHDCGHGSPGPAGYPPGS